MSLTNDQTPHFMIQILFGRYRSIATLQWGHLLILGIIGIGSMYIYLAALKRKFKRYATQIQHIPKFKMFSEATFPKPPDLKPTAAVKENRDACRQLTRKQSARLITSTLRQDQISRIYLLPQDNSALTSSRQVGDCGWGLVDAAAEQVVGAVRVHFNTSIAKSYYAIEKAACTRRPQLKHRDYLTVRDYVQRGLLTNFPTLSPVTCEKYVDCYEKAVFQHYKYTAADYADFTKLVYDIVQSINDPSMQTNINIQRHSQQQQPVDKINEAKITRDAHSIQLNQD